MLLPRSIEYQTKPSVLGTVNFLLSCSSRKFKTIGIIVIVLSYLQELGGKIFLKTPHTSDTWPAGIELQLTWGGPSLRTNLLHKAGKLKPGVC